MKYFTNLPVISYSNNYVRNILTRIKFGDKFKQSAETFYPYVQKESAGDFRYENLAYDYYDDSEDIWLEAARLHVNFYVCKFASRQDL